MITFAQYHLKKYKFMKDFLKYTLASIVGWFIAGIAFVLVAVLTVAGFLASATSESETTVRDNSVYVLELEGNVVERYASSPFDKYMGSSQSTIGLDDLLSSIRKAKEHEKIKGIYLKAGSLVCQPATMQAIRRALADFKESGKFVIAYADWYQQNTYYIASVADRLIVNPKGNISWHGLSLQTVFLKGLLDKVGVDMQVFRVGTYKSAVEPFVATEMSEANREQIQVFLQDTWQQMKKDVAVSRSLTEEQLEQLADKFMDLQPVESYVSDGLADTLLYKDQVVDLLVKQMEVDDEDDLEILSTEDMMGIQRNVPKDMSGNIVAVYYAFGEIDNQADDVYQQEGIHAETVIADLRRLRKDKHVKAVVLRVNSPGGSAYASEQIWREVSLLKAEKPVVVSMGDYAASGGYYISCAADWIVAEPTTLTGSIGIFGMVPNTSKLLNTHLGLRIETVKTNRLADMGDLSRPWTEEEKSLMQQSINQGYELFVCRCAEGRGMSQEAIRQIAEGRVWTGIQAKQLNLVDQLGGMDEAIAEAVKRSGVEQYSLVGYPSSRNLLDRLTEVGVERYLEMHLSAPFDEYYRGFSLLKRLKHADRLQARLPFDVSIH